MTNPIADFMTMRRDIQAYSRGMALWGFMLHVPPLIGGLIYIRTSDGISVTVAVVLALIIAGQIHKRQPMSRLIGICHVFFIPAVAMLGVSAFEGTGTVAFKVWLFYSLIVMAATLIMDAYNLYLYYLTDDQNFVHRPDDPKVDD